MKDQNKIQDLFLNTKPVELLIQLSKPNARHYASALSKDVDVTYSHTVKCLQEMKKMDLVHFKKKGRKKIVKLTEDGKELAENFRELDECIVEETSLSKSDFSSDSGFSLD